MFTVSSEALTILDWAIKREQADEDEKLYVRLAIGVSSCTPDLLTLSLEEKPITGDEIYTFNGIDILIHEDEFSYFADKKLDYSCDALGKPRFHLTKM